MWLFAMAAFLLGLIEAKHLIGISVSVAYLVLMGIPVIAVAGRITRLSTYRVFVILISVAEVLGYSGVVFSLGGVEAQYLIPLYVAYVAYMGIVEHWESPYITAATCTVVYDLMLVLQYVGILPSMRAYPGFTLPWTNQTVIALTPSGSLSGRRRSFDFAEYVRSLVADLFKSCGASPETIVRVEADEISMALDTVIPCGLILNELFSNAVKHAFPGGMKGEILLSVHAGGELRFVDLVVRDNGIGLQRADKLHPECHTD